MEYRNGCRWRRQKAGRRQTASGLIFVRGNQAGVLSAPLLLLDVLVQRLEQPVDLREQVAVVEGERDEEERKGDVLPPQLAEHVAHRERHGGKVMPLIRPPRRFRSIALPRPPVAARKHEIPVLPPLDVNARRLWSAC
jgi:hypothetical protein